MGKHDEGYNWLRNHGHTLSYSYPSAVFGKLILAQCILTELPTQEERWQDSSYSLIKDELHGDKRFWNGLSIFKKK